MKKLLISVISTFSIFAISACNASNDSIYFTSDLIEVEKVENLKDDFIYGMDISSVISLERSGVRFYDFNNQEKDVFEIVSKSGFNHIRIRIWNNPYDENGNYYGGGNADILNAIEIAKRAKKYNLKLILDFHYSDFWADPGKQKAPKLWQDYSLEEKESAIYGYTKECLELIKKENPNVSMVQMGNEINNGLCGEVGFENISKLLKQSHKAIKEIFPDAKTAVHFTNPEKEGLYNWILEELEKYNVEYDVFGSSYYPYWHGSLDNLKSVLSLANEQYHKETMVLETSYAYSLEDYDFHENTIRDGLDDISKPYPFTLQGQASAIRDVIDVTNKIDNCLGVCYWEGAWIPVGTNSLEQNQTLWERCGSGWASSYAGEYDESAKLYHGGTAVDNQALFDKDGKALDTLKLFNILKAK